MLRFIECQARREQMRACAEEEKHNGRSAKTLKAAAKCKSRAILLPKWQHRCSTEILAKILQVAPSTKPSPQLPRTLDDIRSLPLVHQPPTDRHVAIAIPNPWRSLLVVLCFTLLALGMRVEECRRARSFLRVQKSRSAPLARDTKRNERTLCLSTSSRNCQSRCLFLRTSSVSSSSAPPVETSALRFFPSISSSNLCCLSAGVSVHKLGPPASFFSATLADCWNVRDLSLVVSIAARNHPISFPPLTHTHASQ